MTGSFAEIAFTPSVLAAQARYGSRHRKPEGAAQGPVDLSDSERSFITSQDHFFQATVGESGWPYVQFRGGPRGFLKVLGPRTVAFADFLGNRQYLSVGNLDADGRIALILVDQAHRMRLKLWGHARIVDAKDDPEFVASLTMSGYRARVERAIVVEVEAYDWNCPQHITPRFTEAEIDEAVAPLRQELEALRERVKDVQVRDDR